MTERAGRKAEVFGKRCEPCGKRGETTRSLADLAGMSHVYVSDLERGVKAPSLPTIVRMAVALRVRSRIWSTNTNSRSFCPRGSSWAAAEAQRG